MLLRFFFLAIISSSRCRLTCCLRQIRIKVHADVSSIWFLPLPPRVLEVPLARLPILVFNAHVISYLHVIRSVAIIILLTSKGVLAQDPVDVQTFLATNHRASMSSSFPTQIVQMRRINNGCRRINRNPTNRSQRPHQRWGRCQSVGMTMKRGRWIEQIRRRMTTMSVIRIRMRKLVSKMLPGIRLPWLFGRPCRSFARLPSSWIVKLGPHSSNMPRRHPIQRLSLKSPSRHYPQMIHMYVVLFISILYSLQ